MCAYDVVLVVYHVVLIVVIVVTCCCCVHACYGCACGDHGDMLV